MNTTIQTIQQYFTQDSLKLVLSRGVTISKIVARPYLSKDIVLWQIERYINNQVFHTNAEYCMLLDDINNDLDQFRQINIYNSHSTTEILINKKRQVHISTVETHVAQANTTPQSHNKSKSRILPTGSDIPALRDLGIFDDNNNLIKSKSDKYRQINRYIEIIDQQLKHYDKDSIVVCDYGCGKSYLTFLLYHYFAEIRKINITVFGYDLKNDVVNTCNDLAAKYHYSNLHFVTADVASDNIACDVDMMITLHACDTATDYALFHAIKHNIKYIFSAPCCQHEINSSISCQDETDILLADGLIKEKFASLLTDGVRVELLRQCGYRTDVVEFADFSHTPKNLLIRAVAHNSHPARIDLDKVAQLLSRYHCQHTLYSLIKQYYQR